MELSWEIISSHFFLSSTFGCLALEGKVSGDGRFYQINGNFSFLLRKYKLSFFFRLETNFLWFYMVDEINTLYKKNERTCRWFWEGRKALNDSNEMVNAECRPYNEFSFHGGQNWVSADDDYEVRVWWLKLKLLKCSDCIKNLYRLFIILHHMCWDGAHMCVNFCE